MDDELARRVREDAADWVWVPPDAHDFTEPDYRLTFYPDRASVQWSATGRPLAELVAEVRGRARDAGYASLRWWVNGRTAPPDTPAVLEAHGFRPVEEVDVLARPLADADHLHDSLEVPRDVVVRLAEDAEAIRLAGEIGARAFGWPPPTPRQLADEVRMAEQGPMPGELPARRYVAYLAGEPVGSAGWTLAGDTLRLWGGGVVAAARGRGVYRGLLAARCRDGAGLGATLALVKGRTTTSAPILRRAGFCRYATERCFEGPVGK